MFVKSNHEGSRRVILAAPTDKYFEDVWGKDFFLLLQLQISHMKWGFAKVMSLCV